MKRIVLVGLAVLIWAGVGVVVSAEAEAVEPEPSLVNIPASGCYYLEAIEVGGKIYTRLEPIVCLPKLPEPLVSVTLTAPITTPTVPITSTAPTLNEWLSPKALPQTQAAAAAPVAWPEKVGPEHWLGEPGVILDATAAWTIPGVPLTHTVSLPEGGYTYLALGEGKLKVGNLVQVLPPAFGRIYLVIIRGRHDDGTAVDLNQTVEVSDFVPGHAIWLKMPAGTKVSKGWFDQQIEATAKSPNCGMGCGEAGAAFLDVNETPTPKWRFWSIKDDVWQPIG